MEKNEDEEDDETGTDSNGKSGEDEDLNMTMEDMVRKKYAAKGGPILTPIIQPQPQPEKEKSPAPSPSPLPSPTHSIGKTPTPPHSPLPKPTQQEDQPKKQPTKSPSPTPIPKETQQTPPFPTGPVLIPTNIVFQKETLQVIPEDPLTEGEKTSSGEKNGDGGLDQPTTDAVAPGASAAQEEPTVTIIGA